MKKLIAFLLVLVMVLSMVACTAKTEDPTSEAIPPPQKLPKLPPPLMIFKHPLLRKKKF